MLIAHRATAGWRLAGTHRCRARSGSARSPQATPGVDHASDDQRHFARSTTMQASPNAGVAYVVLKDWTSRGKEEAGSAVDIPSI